MAVVYVTDINTNKKVAVNSARISRIEDQSTYRVLHLGTGNLGVNTISAKETISKLLQDFGYYKVTEQNSKRNAAVNAPLVSYILDQGNFREIWFGSQNSAIAFPENTAVLSVTETTSILQPNLSLVLVTNAVTGRKNAVNPNVVHHVEENGGSRSIYFGPTGGRNKPAIISVKETIAQLEKLGIV